MRELKNYSIRELLNLDKGITDLFYYISLVGTVADEQWKGFSLVLDYQGNVQDEIIKRIPKDILEFGFKTDKSPTV